MKKALPILFCLTALPLTSSCIAAVGGAAAATGVVLAQERTAGGTVDDYAIWTKIKSLYLQSSKKGLLNDVNVEVSQGHVLLTGNVISPEVRVEAVKLAWEPHGVVDVANELKISDTIDGRSYAADKVIFANVRSRLLLEKGVRSVNYSIEVVDGVVYVMGIAQNQDELSRVIEICRKAKNVKKVTSFVRIKSAEPAAAR
ncbi:MAG: BON domain-containing protein [Rickettsiales bacterium]